MTNLLVRLFVKDHTHTQDPAVRLRYGRLAGVVGILCNLLLATGKLIAGSVSGSIAIMADAVNNFSDAASSAITLAGFKLAGKPADKEHPYGHARFEYIAGLAVAVMVLVVGVELLRGSVEKIMAPAPVDYGWPSLVVLAAAILVKLWMAFFNRGLGRRIGSATLAATFADSRNDVIASATVLAAALVARYTGLALDGWMGAAVALFILVSGVRLVKDTMDPLLGTAPEPELVRHIRDGIAAYPGVLGTHDLLVHDYGPGRRFASAHVEMASEDDVMKSHDVIDQMERDFLERDGIRLIIHYDPVRTRGTAPDLRAVVARRVKAVDGRLTIHDFRVETDESGVPVYHFDVAAPKDLALDDAALAEQVAEAVAHGGVRPRVELTIDRSYAPIPK